MSAGLITFSDDVLTRLRENIAKLAPPTKPEQKAVFASQLETIDVEQERRLATCGQRVPINS